MGIIDQINKARAKFQDQSAQREMERIRRQTQELNAQKIREGQKVQANAEYQRTKRDVEAIRSYNTKVASSRPNVLRSIGQGIKIAIEKGKAQAKNIEPKASKVSKKGIKKLGSYNSGARQGAFDIGPSYNVMQPRQDEQRSSPFDFRAGKEKNRKGPFEF